MAKEDLGEQDFGRRVERWASFGGPIVGVLAIVVSAYFAIQSETRKELTLSYLAKRPMITAEATRQSAGMVEVQLDGVVVENPWIVSIRVENTGNHPIVSEDIESPLRISFANSVVIGAEVIQRNNRDISARAIFTQSEVTISHALLNPGDWIEADIVFDGEPSIPPGAAPSARISGVSAIKQDVVPASGPKVFPSIVPLPNPAMYFVLAIATLIVVGLFFTCAALIKESFSGVFSQKSSKNTKSHEFELDRVERLQIETNLRARTPLGVVIDAYLEKERILEFIDDPTRVKELVVEQVPESVMGYFNVDAEEAAEAFIIDLRDQIKEALGQMIYTQLPEESNERTKEKFLERDLRGMSVSEMARIAKEEIRKSSREVPRYRWVDTTSLGAAVFVLVLAVALALIVGGTWRTILGI